MLTLQRSLLLMTFLLSTLQSVAATDAAGDLWVNVTKKGDTVVVDARLAIQATQQETWAVLTDYDHMAQFFPNLVSSRIIDRSGDKLRIEQKGEVSYGPFSASFESVRDAELTPYNEIHTHAVGGTLKAGSATTRLVPDGAITWIFYHSESVPAVWVPPAIGPHVIASQTREQFESLRNEVLKRKYPGKAASK